MLIRNKLTLILTGLVLAFQLTFSLFVYTFYSVYRQQEFYGQLQAKAQVFGRVLIGRQDVAHLLSARVRASDLVTLTDEQISIYDARFRTLYDNHNAELDEQEINLLPQLRQQPTVRFTLGPVEGIGTRLRHAGQPYYIFVAGIDQLGRFKRYNLLMLMLIGNLGGLVLILLGSWYVSRYFLRPLSRMTDTVRRISEAHLHTRLPEGNQRDEIARLAMTFNQLLQQLERAFDGQRQFVTHASHELRTPLTNVLGTLDTSLQYDHDPADWRGSMEVATGEIRRVIQLTNSLLSLANVSSMPLQPRPVRLDECVLDAVGQVQRKYRGRKIDLTFGPPSDEFFMVSGNAPLLTAALVNLLDNASKYSDAAVRVVLERVEAQAEQPAHCRISVIDRGRGIPPETLPHVFEPLVRGHNVGSVAGFGIGLAVTHKIITLHQGQIQFQSVAGPGDASGTTVTLRLPVRAGD